MVREPGDRVVCVEFMTSSVLFRQNYRAQISGRYEDLRVIVVVVSTSMTLTSQGKLGIGIMCPVT